MVVSSVSDSDGVAMLEEYIQQMWQMYLMLNYTPGFLWIKATDCMNALCR